MNAEHKRTYTRALKGEALAEVTVKGNGLTGLELYGPRRRRHLVTKDVLGISDNRKVTFTPTLTASYKVVVVNRNLVLSNTYTLTTN